MYDIEKIRKRRMAKIIFTDIIIAACVLVVSGFLIAVVAGWRVNSDLSVEQNGIVSVHTKPTNAKVYFDNNKEFLTSNTSKMLSGGKHTVRIEKEGYTSWEKEINIIPGWLVRLEYPRLFKLNRESKEIKNFKNLNFFYAAPNRSTAILNENDSSSIVAVYDLNSDKPKFKNIELSNVFANENVKNLKNNLEIKRWSKDGKRILIKLDNEWGTIDLKNEKNIINLSAILKDYKNNTDIDFTQNLLPDAANFENDSGDKIIANINGNLICIDTAAKSITKATDEKVEKFSINESALIYLTKAKNNVRSIVLTNIGSNSTVKLADIKDEKSTVTFGLSRYNNVSYILYTINEELKVFRAKDFPTSDTDKESMTEIIDQKLTFTPEYTTTSRNNEFIMPISGQNIALFDIELEKVTSYDYGSNNIRFIDDCIFYQIDENGNLTTWDFDNTNHHTISENNAIGRFDAFISQNEHLLYHIQNSNDGVSLIQEKLD